MTKEYTGEVTGGSYGVFSVAIKSLPNSETQALFGRKVKVTVVDTPEDILRELVTWWDNYAQPANLAGRYPKGKELIERARLLGWSTGFIKK